MVVIEFWLGSYELQPNFLIILGLVLLIDIYQGM